MSLESTLEKVELTPEQIEGPEPCKVEEKDDDGEEEEEEETIKKC